jgi:hypothetical protein
VDLDSMSPQSLNPKSQALDEITRLYPGEWVLLDYCRFDDEGSITHGRVVFRSQDRNEAYRELHQQPNSVLIFLGTLTEEEDRPFLDPVASLTIAG